MWLLGIISNILWLFYKTFRSLADTAREFPYLGDWCADKFEDIAWWFNSLQFEVVMLGRWFEEVRSSLLDLLSWETIYERIRVYFFAGLNPWDWVTAYFWNFIDTYFNWLRDPEFNIWIMIRDRVYALIPPDIVKPWEVWDYVVDYVKDLIAQIQIPSFPTFDAIWDWIRARFKDIDDISVDPAGWFGGMAGAFLSFAALPFWWAIEEFINRIWWEED